jgi:hypothetical protein
MKLTIQQLIDAKACQSQVDLFRDMFGKSVNITQRLCVSVADKFDFGWAAEKLLKPKAWAEYERVFPLAWVEYERVRTSAQAEYERVRTSAQAEYERVRAPAWAEYERVCAKQFAKGYNS